VPEAFAQYIQTEQRCRALVTAMWQVAGDRETLKTVADTLRVDVQPYTEDPTQDGLAPEEGS